MAPHRLLVLALTPALAVAQPWPTTDWTVICTEITEEHLGDLAELECDDSLVTGAATVARFELDRASPWLRDLGFPSPLVEQTDDGMYLAWISDEVAEAYDAWGVYFLNDHELYLKSDYWIRTTLGGGTGELGIFRDRPSDRTMIHELFHAIQQRFRDGRTNTDPYKWLWEGTAEGVEYAWFTTRYPDSPPLHPTTARGLDESLHEPPDCGRSCPGAYRRYYFWSQLGEILGAPGRIGYLTHILQQDLREASGLTGLHTGLQRWHGNGLTHYYPEFVARYGAPRGLYHDAGFTEETVHPPSGGAEIEAPFSDTVLPVATRAYNILIPMSPDDTIGLTVMLEGNEETLHLIVDGERYDEPGPGQNTYQTVLSGMAVTDTLRIRVANIGPEPAETEDEAYTLTVKLDSGVLPCNEVSLIAALNRRSPEMRTLVDQAAAVRARMVATDETESVFLLGRGELSVNGDGGAACVTPFGVSDLEWEADRDPAADAEATADALVARHLPRVSRETGVSEAHILLLLEGTMPPGLTPQQMRAVMESIRTIAAEPQSDDPSQSGVYFHIFSPNLIPVVGGGIAPDNLRSPDTAITLHNGVGGWAANAAASAIVYLPGVQAADIQGGGLYPAVAFSRAPDYAGPVPDGPETNAVFYTRWRGDWETYRCNGTAREDFNGEQTAVYGVLEGSVAISEVTPTRIEGTFQLSGPGTQETFTGTVERTFDLDCPRRGETDERTAGASVSISGRFTAPNMKAPLPFGIAGVGRAVPVGRR